MIHAAADCYPGNDVDISQLLADIYAELDSPKSKFVNEYPTKEIFLAFVTELLADSDKLSGDRMGLVMKPMDEGIDAIRTCLKDIPEFIIEQITVYVKTLSPLSEKLQKALSKAETALASGKADAASWGTDVEVLYASAKDR